MATTILLIRHAVHDRINRTLCGRMAGVGLSPAGREQAALLAERLRRQAVVAIYTSPLERARETAVHLGMAPRISDAVNEIDYGAWTGRAFASLDDDPDWLRWNTERSHSRPPGGESMAEAQDRAMRGLVAMCERHPDSRIAVVSHCDIIKAVLAAWLEMPLNAWPRFEIAPASVSTLVSWPGGGKVLCMNATS